MRARLQARKLCASIMNENKSQSQDFSQNDWKWDWHLTNTLDSKPHYFWHIYYQFGKYFCGVYGNTFMYYISLLVYFIKEWLGVLL